MSFKTAAENAELTAARSKIDRLLIALPADESKALRELLHNTQISTDKISRIIKLEAETHDYLDSAFFNVSSSAVKRWRNDNVTTSVNGL